MNNNLIKIRCGQFETNSSMTHVIGIPKNTKINNLEIPEKLTFHFEAFETTPQSYNDVQNKANYLYMAIIDRLYPLNPVYNRYADQLTKEERDNRLNVFIKTLNDLKAVLLAHGVKEVEFEGIPALGTSVEDSYLDFRDIDEEKYYIYGLWEFFETEDIIALCKDASFILPFLFDSDTKLIFGRDEMFDETRGIELEELELDMNTYEVYGDKSWSEYAMYQKNEENGND